MASITQDMRYRNIKPTVSIFIVGKTVTMVPGIPCAIVPNVLIPIQISILLKRSS